MPAAPAVCCGDRDEVSAVKFFRPSMDPAEGLGVLVLFRLIEEAVPSFFRPDRRIRIVRAPGRLDVLGGRAPGPGSLVLQLPIAEAACIALQERDDDLVRLWSPSRDGSRTQMLSMSLADLGLPGAPIDYAECRALFGGDPRDHWASYLLGALVVLARELGLRPARGAELLLHSDIPEGRGVGSSTAVAVVALRAFAQQHGRELAPAELARLAALVEAEAATAPVRPVDARALVSAEAGELLVLRGELGAVEQSLVVPMDLEFIGLDSGVPARGPRAAPPDGLDDADAARFLQLWSEQPTALHRQELGDLLFAAHARYAQRGCNEPSTDLIVDAARQRRAAGGAVLGAKATGRGGGGSVLLLGERGKIWYEALRIKKALLTATGHSAHVFRWSSPGASSFGSIELEPGGDG
jgi:galactokinase